MSAAGSPRKCGGCQELNGTRARNAGGFGPFVSAKLLICQPREPALACAHSSLPAFHNAFVVSEIRLVLIRRSRHRCLLKGSCEHSNLLQAGIPPLGLSRSE